MKGVLYLILSGILATVASLIFVEKFSNASIIIGFIAAVILTSPTNWLFSKAQNHVKDITTALVIFSIVMTITDTLGGIVIQGSQVNNWLTLIIGLLTGIIIVLNGAKSKNIDEPPASKEIVLYTIGVLVIMMALIYRQIWQVQVVSYAIADFMGAVLSLRLLRYIPANTKFGSLYEYIIGTVAFMPVMLMVVLLFQTMKNIAIAGPAVTISSCAITIVGSKLLTGKRPNLNDLNYLVLSVVCVWLIAISF